MSLTYFPPSTAANALFRFPNGAFHQDGYTTLSTTIPNPSDTSDIQVASTSAFSASGAILIGSELIKYTGKTSTTFTGITRSAYGSSGASHTAGVYVSEAQAAPSSTSSLPIVMSVTDASNEVALDGTDKSKIVFSIAGYYNIQFSAQLLSYDGTIDNVCMWFNYNGSAIADSASYISVPAIHGGVPGAAILSLNLVVAAAAGSNIQLLFSSTTGNTVCATYPPATSPTRPASPSIILTATFVSGLY